MTVCGLRVIDKATKKVLWECARKAGHAGTHRTAKAKALAEAAE